MTHRDNVAALVANHAIQDVSASIHANAKTHIDAAAPHSGHVIVAQGTYSGDGTQNRAIPHTLGVIPHMLISIAVSGAGYAVEEVSEYNGHLLIWSTTGVDLAVTAMDATNFYVGNAVAYRGNEAGTNYHWTVFR